VKFTQEHEEIRRSLKRFIDNEINPHVDEWEAAEQFPAHEVFKKLGSMGMLGLTKPEAYGGAGLDYSFSMVFAETLGQIRCGGVPMAPAQCAHAVSTEITKSSAPIISAVPLKSAPG